MAANAEREQIEQIERSQVRQKQVNWIAERILWSVLALIVVAAVVGLLGRGPLSKGTARSEGGGVDIEVEYPRLSRMVAPVSLEVRVSAPRAEGDSIRVLLPSSFADGISIERILPQPDSTSLNSEGLVYEWQVEDWSGPLTIRFDYRAETWPAIDGEVQVEAGESETRGVSFTQIVFP